MVHGAALAAGAPNTMNSATMATTTAVILFTFKPFLPLGAPKRVGAKPLLKKPYPDRRATMRDNGRVFTTCSGGGPAAPRGARPTSSMFPSPRDRVGVGRADDLDAGRERLADVLAAQVEPVRQAVDLERDALLERDLERALEVERVLGPAADVAGPSGG